MNDLSRAFEDLDHRIEDLTATLERRERRITHLETALLSVMRGPFNGTSAMAMTFGCVVLNHPDRDPLKPGACFCGIRK